MTFEKWSLLQNNAANVWIILRKVVNPHQKRWRKVVIMLKRKVLPRIEEWHQGGCRKALLLTRARQVGKTTVVREFAKQHYAHFVEVNFVKRPIAQKVFDGDLDTKTIIANLSAMGFGPFVKGKTK